MTIAGDGQGNPTRDSIQPELVVTLIHGTFAPGAEWIRPGSAIRAGLGRAFGNRIQLNPFRWSGGNTIAARKIAEGELVERVEAIGAAHPGTRQILIAHSHGGNVALYANRYPFVEANVAGIACIATPFLHAGERDLRAFNGPTLASGFFCLGVLAICLAWAIGWLLGWLGFWALFVAVGVCWVISFVLGGWLYGVLVVAQRTTPDVVRHLNCQVKPSTNLFIVRKVGDEASLALGAGQLFFWAMNKAFTRFAPQKGRPHWLNTRNGRLLAIAVMSLWACAFVLAVASIWQHEMGVDIGAIPKFVLGLAVIATLLVRYFFGAVLLGLAIAMSLGTLAHGMVPPRELFDMNIFGRWIFGIALALAVEVNTEATPEGRWVTWEYGRTEDDRRADSQALVHSAYDDPRLIEDLIRWIAASTGLRDERADRSQ